MTKGELRIKIMRDCPEDFEDELKEFIDNIEALVGDIRGELDIERISDIGRIEEAYRLADELSDALY